MKSDDIKYTRIHAYCLNQKYVNLKRAQNMKNKHEPYKEMIEEQSITRN